MNLYLKPEMDQNCDLDSFVIYVLYIVFIFLPKYQTIENSCLAYVDELSL